MQVIPELLSRAAGTVAGMFTPAVEPNLSMSAGRSWMREANLVEQCTNVRVIIIINDNNNSKSNNNNNVIEVVIACYHSEYKA